MKIKFKHQAYQLAAVQAVIDCFEGQTKSSGQTYRIDPGKSRKNTALGMEYFDGLKNHSFSITENGILSNIQNVQKGLNIPQSSNLKNYYDIQKKKEVKSTYHPGANINLDIEMETGTGKTYCYLRTIFELNKQYGWNKFIIIVPSVAIREGVFHSIKNTAEHFAGDYGKKARPFVYNSKNLHEIEDYATEAGIGILVINIQAFNAAGKDNRRIYEKQDDFQSRRPIDVISANNPILILDEPQKMGGDATLKALPKFKPLFILRYSATHSIRHNLIYRLDALDAYNQKLVKKIGVRGISVRGLKGNNSYMYLEGIDISKSDPIARIEIEVRLKSGEIKRKTLKLGKGARLVDESNGLAQYDGLVISEIDAVNDVVEFKNGEQLNSGDATGDVDETTKRRIQIREVINAHLAKEQELFSRGVKVLSLLFIDEVIKYRDYSREDTKGEYARIFEEEYEIAKQDFLNQLALGDEKYREFIQRDANDKIHKGYFSIDKKTKRDKEPEVKGDESDDADAYDLILKDKEKLLGFDEPTRFIFSHSALREGWDNPNVFVIGMLKHSNNDVSRRQEVGRGLRLCVNQNGDRIDEPAIVHDVNVLTVVTSESYHDFVDNLQKEIAAIISSRPQKANKEYFVGKVIRAEAGNITINEQIAHQIYKYLLKNDYINDDDTISESYKESKSNGTLADLPADLAPYKDEIFALTDAVFDPSMLPKIPDDRKPKPVKFNIDNFNKSEFQKLWKRINHKAIYFVKFKEDELIEKCVSALNKELNVDRLIYYVESGTQKDQVSDTQLRAGEGFIDGSTRTEKEGVTSGSNVKYDLLGEISEKTELPRKTIAAILTKILPAIFGQFKLNPESFIAKASTLINEQKSTAFVEHISYNVVEGEYDTSIFTADKTRQDFSQASEKLKKHIYDYVVTDSQVERNFANALENSSEVIVYAKLPKGFKIPTPVGDYNPDWAVSFEEGSVKHIYFVAETKGNMSSLSISKLEQSKIDYAKKFFQTIIEKGDQNPVKYSKVTSYNDLMNLVKNE